MIIWIVVSVLAIAAFVLLLAVAVVIIKFVIELMMRVALATGIAMTVGCIVGIVAAQWDADGIVAGTVAFLLAFFSTLVSVWRWRDSATDKFDRRGAMPHRAIKPKGGVQMPIERQLDLTEAVRLSDAWDSASRLATENALDRPRIACARFLASFEAKADCDPRNVELAVFIRRQISALVDETEAALHDASLQEREGLIAGMAAALKQLGREAAVVSERRSALAKERLGLRWDHFSRRRPVQGDWDEALRYQQVAYHEFRAVRKEALPGPFRVTLPSVFSNISDDPEDRQIYWRQIEESERTPRTHSLICKPADIASY